MPTESASSNAMRASQLPPAPAPAPSMLDLAAREIREGGGYSSDAEEDGGFSFLDSPDEGAFSYVDFPKDAGGFSSEARDDESGGADDPPSRTDFAGVEIRNHHKDTVQAEDRRLPSGQDGGSKRVVGQRARGLAGLMGNSESLAGAEHSAPPALEALHGTPLFSRLLETSWALKDEARWLDGAQDSIMEMGLQPWLISPSVPAAVLGGAWMGEQVWSGMNWLANIAATWAGIVESTPAVGDFLDFGLQSAKMGWAAATNEHYREDLMTPIGRKQAIKQYLGNPSDAGVPLSGLFEGTDPERQKSARDLLVPHQEAILQAAEEHALEPEMVGALALAEQRDQRGAENVMDWLMGTIIGEGETSSGLTQVTANSARRYDLVEDQDRITDRQLAIALHDPATNLLAGAERLRVGADLGAQAEADGRNRAVDDLMSPGQRVDLSVMAQHSNQWDDAHRRLAIEEYTSSPFDEDLLQNGHIPGASSGWGWFGVEGYHDIQRAGIFGSPPSTAP